MNEITVGGMGQAIPFAVTVPDRIPAQRYYDAEFFELEKQHLWPRVWQMACRLEEIPEVGDYQVYRNLDQSVIVMRTSENEVKAYQNHCRHRGVELVQTRGKARGGFICPFHGWRWDREGNNTYAYVEHAFRAENMCKDELNLVPVRLETWLNCAFINFDNDAPALRDTLGEFGRVMDAFKGEQLRAEWWLAAKLPVNWKLAMEAFMEGYHVATTHPQLLPPGVTNKPNDATYAKLPDDMISGTFWTTVGSTMPDEVDSRQFIDSYANTMAILNEGMAGMSAIEEVEIAKGLRDTPLPAHPMAAAIEFRKVLNKAIADHYKSNGMDCGDFDAIDKAGLSTSVNHLFPHFFILPVHGAASSYRIRPTGPEECIFELWSLKRYPEGQEPGPLPVPEPKPHDDPSWPPIPRQDYANLPKQQRGLHNAGFEYMRLSDQMEGLISNFHRTLDGFLAGLPSDHLVKAQQVTSGPIDVPVKDLGF